MLARLQALMRHSRDNPQADGKLIVAGTSVPADASTGYQAGCLYQKVDGGVGSSLYINHGSLSSALFQPVEAIGTAQAFLNIPVGSFVGKDGTPIVIFSDGAMTGTPGWNTDNEASGIRWEHDGTPDPVKASVPIPNDLDADEDVILHICGYKVGATSGDTINWTVEVFKNRVGYLWDGDSSFGGECDDLVNTTKLVQESTLTLASANVAGSPCILTVTIHPKDGKLGTDDAIISGVWLEYTKKALAT